MLGCLLSARQLYKDLDIKKLKTLSPGTPHVVQWLRLPFESMRHGFDSLVGQLRFHMLFGVIKKS